MRSVSRNGPVGDLPDSGHGAPLSKRDWLEDSSSAARISVDDAKSLHERFLEENFEEHSFCFATDPSFGLRVGGLKFGQLM